MEPTSDAAMARRRTERLSKDVGQEGQKGAAVESGSRTSPVARGSADGVEVAERVDEWLRSAVKGEPLSLLAMMTLLRIVIYLLNQLLKPTVRTEDLHSLLTERDNTNLLKTDDGTATTTLVLETPSP